MALLNELFACVWDRIETNLEAAKRPEIVAINQARSPDICDSRLEQFPVGKYLEPSLKAAEQSGCEAISGLLRQTRNSLAWSQNESYLEARLGSRFIENYVTGILTGPEGNLARDAPCSGFVLLGPNTEYPEHSHSPREVYLVLTPGTEWCLDGADWFSVDPGQVIYHSVCQSHAMRTHAIPMLAFAAWLDHGNRSAITI